jgi:hypothetical protein
MCHFYFLLLCVFCFTAKRLGLLSQTRYNKSRMPWMKSDCQPVSLWEDLSSQLQCLAGLCNSPNQRLYSRWFDSQSRAELPAVFSSAVIQCFSGICFIETNDERGLRNCPAVISTETGTRLDEYRGFRHVVRNGTLIASTLPNLGNWSTPLLNFLHEQTPSCLPLPLSSNTSV